MYNPLLFALNNETTAKLKELGATHFSCAFNFGTMKNGTISSIHFFTGDELDQNGELYEVAYLMPSMQMPLKPLSGFNTVERKNGIDTETRSIDYEELYF